MSYTPAWQLDLTFCQERFRIQNHKKVKVPDSGKHKRFLRIDAFVSLAVRIFGLVKRHPYPIVVSFWVGIIFAERLATDQVVYGLKRHLKESAVSTATVFSFLTI